MNRSHQPGSEPIDIPETIPNPVVVPKPTHPPRQPAPKEPVRIPEKVPAQVLRDQTRRREARDLLAPVHGWFRPPTHTTPRNPPKSITSART